jgi:hypothetical protein
MESFRSGGVFTLGAFTLDVHVPLADAAGNAPVENASASERSSGRLPGQRPRSLRENEAQPVKIAREQMRV